MKPPRESAANSKAGISGALTSRRYSLHAGARRATRCRTVQVHLFRFMLHVLRFTFQRFNASRFNALTNLATFPPCQQATTSSLPDSARWEAPRRSISQGAGRGCWGWTDLRLRTALVRPTARRG